MKKKKKRPSKPRRWDAILRRLPNDRPLLGAEIGVLNANTSMRLLEKRPLLTLIMVDPWEVPAPGSSYALENDTNAQKPQDQHEAAYKLTLKRVAFAGKRAIIKRLYSVEAAQQVKNGSLFFAFIDGDHSYPGCKLDNITWLPKIMPGGFISGHDYDHPKLPGVKQAVDEIFGADNIETDVNRTWFVRV